MKEQAHRCHIWVYFCALVWQALTSQWCYRPDAFWVLSGEMSPNQQSCVSHKGIDNGKHAHAHARTHSLKTLVKWMLIQLTAIERIDTCMYVKMVKIPVFVLYILLVPRRASNPVNWIVSLSTKSTFNNICSYLICWGLVNFSIC